VLAFNNPYSAVVDRHVADYFDSGAVSPYRGLWEAGIKAYYHHRTLEDYLDAFQAGGLRLIKLADIAALAGSHKPDAYLPPGGPLPTLHASCVPQADPRAMTAEGGLWAEIAP